MKVRVDSLAWLPKAELSLPAQQALKAALTIMPIQMQGFASGEEDDQPIRLYEETDDHIGVAREYYLNRVRPDHKVEIDVSEGDRSSWPGELTFNPERTMRPEQALGMKAVLSAFRTGTLGGTVNAYPGWGKCLGAGTPVLMYDGRIVPVESLVPGDQLMGPDSQPRTIQSVSSGRGPLFAITPVKGDPWVCNDAHILTLVHSVSNAVIDIALQDYLSLSTAAKHHLKQFTPPDGVRFSHSVELPLDPYFLGVWLGDGTKSLAQVEISKPDPEILDLCWDIARQYGLVVNTYTSGACPTHRIVSPSKINPLLQRMRAELGDASAVPLKFLTASLNDRAALLAGFLDSDGYHNNGCYQIVQKRLAYAEAIAFLARSLGLRATIRPKKVDGEIYHRVQLSGDFMGLPMRIPRKKPRVRKQKKRANRTGFRVAPCGPGLYYGFTLDGDGRFLLGDFTVTHNTTFACKLIQELQVPTLVVVHKEFLMSQWVERIQEYLPGAKVGVIQQKRCEFQGKHVAVGMVHSLAKGAYPSELLRWPGLVIADECHRLGARTWAPVPAMFPAKHRLGLSGTLRRKDGAENVFNYHLGSILFTAKAERLKPTIKRVFSSFRLVETPAFNPTLAPESLILRFLCANDRRNRDILQQVKAALKAGRKILILSKRVDHLKRLDAMFQREWKEDGEPAMSIGYYIGGMKEEARDASSRCRLIFATAQFAAEGLDIPSLDTLFLVTPMVDVEQAVGRILRSFDGKKDPIVVDVRDDNIPMFRAYAEKREKLYARIT